VPQAAHARYGVARSIASASVRQIGQVGMWQCAARREGMLPAAPRGAQPEDLDITLTTYANFCARADHHAPRSTRAAQSA